MNLQNVSYHGGRVKSTKNISSVTDVGVMWEYEWLTTNSVVVGQQVLSPADQDRGQTYVSVEYGG